ncbi:MAG: DUF1540 domain-containing protein [Eubacteriaceae bacterium]
MKINSNIVCNVKECKYHAQNQDYCSLDKIKIVKNANNVTDEKETDCHSFQSMV